MTEHTTHYEDCGCLSKRFAERIAELERDNRNMHSLNDGMRETVAELEANAEELMAEVKMYGAANGELKDALDEALTELAATMNALSAAHEALTSAESALSMSAIDEFFCIESSGNAMRAVKEQQARITELEAKLSREKESVEIANQQWSEWMTRARALDALIAVKEEEAETCIVALEKRVQQAETELELQLNWKEHILRLETELAALKGRRCEGCRYWLANGCPQIGGWHPADFSCSEWQPLPEARP